MDDELSDERKIELGRAYAVRRISFEELLASLPANLASNKKYAEEIIRGARERKSTLDLEFGLKLMRTSKTEPGYDVDTGLLCDLLFDGWHQSHEDIAFSLARIKDPHTVDCLYRAAELNYDYLDYDDTFQFARKCIKGLSAIGTESAIDSLKLISRSENEVIRDYALKELGRLG